jgi:hypothetical protein
MTEVAGKLAWVDRSRWLVAAIADRVTFRARILETGTESC